MDGHHGGLRMGEDGHGSLGNFQGVAFCIGRRHFLALLRYPDSVVLSLIMNCGRIVDFGLEGERDLYAKCFRCFTHWRADGETQVIPAPPIQEYGITSYYIRRVDRVPYFTTPLVGATGNFLCCSSMCWPLA